MSYKIISCRFCHSTLFTSRYVLVKTEDGAKFVTKLDNATKTAFWNCNEAPMPFNKSYAEDLALCLTLNFHLAFVMKSYHELKTQISIFNFEP